MSAEYDDDTRVTEQAARWLGSLLENNESREAFFAWLAESPRHVEEFLFLLGDAGELAGLRPEEREKVEHLAQELGPAGSPPPNVVPVSQRALASYETHMRPDSPTAEGPAPLAQAPSAVESPRGPFARRRPRLRLSLAVAASLVCAAAGIFWFAGAGRWTTYETTIGEQRTLELADGSVIHLNTDSKIAVRFDASSRQVELMRGEALFNVGHDAARTFTVHAAQAVIQAIGTEFDVYRSAGDTRVAVIDGLVQLSRGDLPARFPIERVSWTSAFKHASAGGKEASPAEGGAQSAGTDTQLLEAGEAATISLEGQVARSGGADIAKAVAWRQRRLVFESDSLGHIATEFNRYNSRLRIRVEGTAAEQRHFSGTFDADAPEALIQALEGDGTLSIEKNGDEIVIQDRRPDTSDHAP